MYFQPICDCNESNWTDHIRADNNQIIITRNMINNKIEVLGNAQ